jgi:hypothetical protein
LDIGANFEKIFRTQAFVWLPLGKYWQRLRATVPETDDEKNQHVKGLSGQTLEDEQSKQETLSKFTRSRRLTTVELLNALETKMHNESFASNVNYFSLHIRCVKLLQTMMAEMDPVFVNCCGP